MKAAWESSVMRRRVDRATQWSPLERLVKATDGDVREEVNSVVWAGTRPIITALAPVEADMTHKWRSGGQ